MTKQTDVPYIERNFFHNLIILLNMVKINNLIYLLNTYDRKEQNNIIKYSTKIADSPK